MPDNDADAKKSVLFVRRFPKTQNAHRFAITFDDGPHGSNTDRILDILEKSAARGTFFSTGNNIAAHASKAAQVAGRGHLLANHTYSHVNPLVTGKKKLHDELLRTKNLIEDITGRRNRYFRPPYGIVTPSLLSICRTLELTIVLWNVNSYDFRGEHSAVIGDRIKKKIKPGAIVLFHECKYNDETLDYSGTFGALETTLAIANDETMRAVTIDELMRDR